MKEAILLCVLYWVGYSMAAAISEELLPTTPTINDAANGVTHLFDEEVRPTTPIINDEDRLARGCIYINGDCMEVCPVGTQGYSIGCGHIVPEVTCDEPHPQPEEDETCDHSACYCDPPTVRDTASNKCVLLRDCPKKL